MSHEEISASERAKKLEILLAVGRYRNHDGEFRSVVASEFSVQRVASNSHRSSSKEEDGRFKNSIIIAHEISER